MIEKYETDPLNYAGTDPFVRDAQVAVEILYFVRYARYLTGRNPDEVALRAVKHHKDVDDCTSDVVEILDKPAGLIA